MFKTLRRYYWVVQSFLARHLTIIIRTTLIVLTGLAIFFFFARYLPTPKNMTRIGRVGKYSPEALPGDIQSTLSVGLVSLSVDGKVKPGLAKSWTVSDDGKTYVFTLDPDLRWHDGTAVIPADITYNFQDVQTELGNGTVTYHLKEPFAPFLSAVSRPLLKKNHYGTKDFRLVSTQSYGGDLQSLTIENSDERRLYKFYPTESSAITAFRLGEVNRVEGLSLVPDVYLHDPTNIVATDLNFVGKQSVLFFNNNDSILSSKSTRQALAYAIKDKSFGHTRTLSPISQSSWAYNEFVKTYDYDAAHAKTLLGQDVKDPGSVKLELKTTLQYLDVAESIAQSWRDTLGIGVTVKVVSTMSSDYQILLADFTPPIDPDQYSLWHSTQATNFTHFNNLKVDKLLEDGRRTLDIKLRTQIYQDFQRFLLEDCPAVFLFQSDAHTLSRKPLF
jgi:peptide/nickel transport system substrate-binding protein